MYTHKYVCLCSYTPVSTYLHTYVCLCVCVCLYTYLHTYACPFSYALIYPYLFIHIPIDTCMFLFMHTSIPPKNTPEIHVPLWKKIRKILEGKTKNTHTYTVTCVNTHTYTHTYMYTC